MKRIIWLILSGLTIITVVLTFVFLQQVKQLYHTVRLFDEDRIVHNFTHMGDIYPTVEIKRSGPAYTFSYDSEELPESFFFNGEARSIISWLEESSTTALIVIMDSTITHEQYFLGTDENDKRISWSMSKSFLSVLFGMMVHEGYIPDLNIAVTDYVPELIGTGYEGITIKNVLQMSSGVYFNEDYSDFNSDINRFGRAISIGSSFDEFAASLETDPNREQATYLHYVSIDTHVLGMVLRAATEKTIQELFEEKLWPYLGMEQDAYFISDGIAEPMVLGGLNMISRDYARFATLIKDGGERFGVQVIPPQWLTDSITPDAAHLMPGKRETSSSDFGYGYQWWIPVPEHPENAPVEIMAKGIYGQFMYINPTLDVVIVKNSADIHFMDNDYEHTQIALSAFRTIASHLTAK